MYTSVIDLGPQTNALRAKRLLWQSGIRTELKKESEGKKGCTYVLELDTSKLTEALRLLHENRIDYRVTRTQA